MAQKFIFLDRDGTLILDIPYLRDPKKVQLLEHVIEGLVHLKNAGFRFGIVTNQSGIDRGLVTLDELRAVNQHMCELFGEFNLFFDFIAFCPHAPEKNCWCRKPKPELGLKAIKEFNVDVSASFMIGDNDSDVEFGANLNLATVRIKSHYPSKISSTYTSANLLEASKQIESFDDTAD